MPCGFTKFCLWWVPDSSGAAMWSSFVVSIWMFEMNPHIILFCQDKITFVSLGNIPIKESVWLMRNNECINREGWGLINYVCTTNTKLKYVCLLESIKKTNSRHFADKSEAELRCLFSSCSSHINPCFDPSDSRRLQAHFPAQYPSNMSLTPELWLMAAWCFMRLSNLYQRAGEGDACQPLWSVTKKSWASQAFLRDWPG